MILPVARWSSTCLYSSRKRGNGFNKQYFPVPSEQRRISSYGHFLKYYYHHNMSIRASSSDSSNNNNNNNSEKNKFSNKRYEVIVPSYSNDDHQLDETNIPRHVELIKLLGAIYDFCRPYTMIITVITVPSISTLPLRSLAEVSPAFIVEVHKVLAVFLLSQAYISGINEIFDFEIDQVNKPYLPIVSGALSMELAIAVVSMSLIGCLGLAIMFRSPPLLIGAFISCLFGTLYSIEVPYLRWKRYPALATLCFIMHSAVAMPFATFCHIQKYVLGRPILFTKSLIFTSCFATLTSIVLALCKDIPDIEGDRKFGFQSISVRFGGQRVFWICVSTLILMYGCAMGVGFTSPFLISKLVIVFGHFSMACILLHRALSTDLSVEGAAQDFYMFIWNLIYSEYLLIPFVL